MTLSTLLTEARKDSLLGDLQVFWNKYRFNQDQGNDKLAQEFKVKAKRNWKAVQKMNPDATNSSGKLWKDIITEEVVETPETVIVEGTRREDNDSDLGSVLTDGIPQNAIAKINGIKSVGYSDAYDDNTSIMVYIELDPKIATDVNTTKSSMNRKTLEFADAPRSILKKYMALVIKSIDGKAKAYDIDTPKKKKEYASAENKKNAVSYYTTNQLSFELSIPLR